MTKHEQILSMLPHDLKEPIDIPASPVNEATRIYSIGGDKEHGIWLRIGDGTWHKLEESDQNYFVVALYIIRHLTNEIIYESSNQITKTLHEKK